MTNLYVSISPQEAANRINDAVTNNSVTGELIDEYVITTDSDTVTIVQVYEKLFLRVENRLTLTVVIDNTGKNFIELLLGYIHILSSVKYQNSILFFSFSF